MYINSLNYDAADSLFELLETRLPKFSKQNLEMLLAGIGKNNQTYGRGRAVKDHASISTRCLEVFGEDFDLSKYHFLPEI